MFENDVFDSLGVMAGMERGSCILCTNTDGACARRWKEIADLKTDYVDDEIHRALEAKFGVKVPKPVDTVYQYWDAAW